MHYLFGPVLFYHKHVIHALYFLCSDIQFANFIFLILVLAQFFLEQFAILLRENILKLIFKFSLFSFVNYPKTSIRGRLGQLGFSGDGFAIGLVFITNGCFDDAHVLACCANICWYGPVVN